MKSLLILLLIIYSNLAFAAKNIRIINDAETENTIRNFIKPLVKAAKLNDENLKINIIVDPSINAFVIGGTNVFINTGLLIQFADDPNILYGVMAHEIAHIYAGHISIKRNEYEAMNKLAISGALLGLATALVGAPDAGIAIGMGSMQAAYGNLLRYSREHETEADKIAVDLLYKTHNNGEGLVKLFQYLSRRERVLALDPYAITHPLSAERIKTVKNAIQQKLSSFPYNIKKETIDSFKRIANKLDAYLKPSEQVINQYKNNSYALAIGYFRQGNLNQAIKLLDQVIELEKNNPYLYELKGQFYFENGKFSLATEFYQKAFKFLPSDRLIKTELAAAYINQAGDHNNKALLSNAISLLMQVTAKDTQNILAYFMLSKAYGKMNEQKLAIAALAEYYFYQGAIGKSKILADKVLKMASPGSHEYLRAKDIVQYTKDFKE